MPTVAEKVLELSILASPRTFREHLKSAVRQVDVTIGGSLSAKININNLRAVIK